jgi:hypothetical protein
MPLWDQRAAVGAPGGQGVDQRDEAWLQALAARVDDGQPIDWEAEERRARGEQADIVRALRIVAEIAGQARQATETVESTPVTERLPPSPAPNDADDEPVSDRYRSFTPSEPAEIRRKLLFGASLVLALASVYSGLLGWGRVLQYGLAGLAVLVVLIALVSGATGPPQPPRPGPPA